MTFTLTDREREDPRTYVGPAAIRLPGKSARLARVRRNKQMLETGKMWRPHLVIAMVHRPAVTDFSRPAVYIEYAERWQFGRGDTFPAATHGRTIIPYKDIK
jgi:hypothetical protein